VVRQGGLTAFSDRKSKRDYTSKANDYKPFSRNIVYLENIWLNSSFLRVAKYARNKKGAAFATPFFA